MRHVVGEASSRVALWWRDIVAPSISIPARGEVWTAACAIAGAPLAVWAALQYPSLVTMPAAGAGVDVPIVTFVLLVLVGRMLSPVQDDGAGYDYSGLVVAAACALAALPVAIVVALVATLAGHAHRRGVVGGWIPFGGLLGESVIRAVVGAVAFAAAYEAVGSPSAAAIGMVAARGLTGTLYESAVAIFDAPNSIRAIATRQMSAVGVGAVNALWTAVTVVACLAGGPWVLPTVLAPVLFHRALGSARRQLDEMNSELMLDPLTGIYNRRFFWEELARRVDAQRARGGELAVILIDVDFFKLINDRHGHLEGDRALVAVARSVSGSVRGGQGCRYGGEEFSAMVSVADAREAMIIADRIRVSALQSLAPWGTTVSVGVALLDSMGGPETPEAVTGRADRALYAAKHAGKNRVVLDGFAVPGLAQAA